MNDERAWTTAGKLRLIDHLNDVKLRCLGPSQKRRDHEALARFGYDMTACTCLHKVSGSVIPIWGRKPV